MPHKKVLKEENVKPSNMPMGRIQAITKNSLGEVTGAIVLKGSSGEEVKRHASVLIPLLQDIGQPGSDAPVPAANALPQRPPRRAAASVSAQRTRDILTN